VSNQYSEKDDPGNLDLMEMLVNSSIDPPDTTNISVFDLVASGVKKIRIVQNANNSALDIYSVEAYTVPMLDEEPDCIIYNVSYTPERSGNHKIMPEVVLEERHIKRMDASSFFVNYGYPVIAFGGTTMLVGQNTYEPKIEAVGGDLRNITVNISFSNMTVLNLSAGENMTKNITFVACNAEDVILWSLNASEEGTTNVTLTVNSTTIPGLFANETENFTVLLEDMVPPVVNDFWFTYNQTNLKGVFVVSANITDNGTYIVNATANVKTPGGSWFNTTAESTEGGDVWNITLDASKLNATGNYTVRIFAYDLGDNMNWSGEVAGPQNLSFNVTDEYHFALIEHEIYNRGETVTINVLDVNNNTVAGADWVVNITRYGENETNVLDGVADSYDYYVGLNDTAGNYTVFANATKDGNYVLLGHEMGFNVSKTLNVVFNTTFKPEYAASESLGVIMAKLYNARDEPVIINNLWLYYKGENESMLYDSDPLVSLYHTPLIYSATSSATPGTTLPLKVNVSYNNNTGEVAAYIKTKTDANNNGGGGGGGGGSSALGTISYPPQYFENKTPVANFNYTIEYPEREITQGVPDTIMATIANTGDLDLVVHTKVDECPVEVSIDDMFELGVNADESFQIIVYAKLAVESGVYYADITLYNEKFGLEKTRTLKIEVIKNSRVSALDYIKTEFKVLQMQIASFEAVGLDVESLKEKTRQIEKFIEAGNEAILNDDASALEEAVNKAKNPVLSAQMELMPLKAMKFFVENKLELAGIALALLALMYFTVYFVSPYTEITTKIRKLKRQEKIIIATRKATEKKYFLRQITEATFTKIMADEEDLLLKVKSEISKLMHEHELLKHFRIFEFRHMEEKKKRKKERINREKELKEKAKRTMSDVIIEHDMKKKPGFLERFLDMKKKRKEFVFDSKQEKKIAERQQLSKEMPQKAADAPLKENKTPGFYGKKDVLKQTQGGIRPKKEGLLSKL
ncbi:MAG: hypothetical protein DRJ64_08630, partial [Thermoprotei archaeon]